MAEIKIYGTLKNDTGEPIATADQILDPDSGKYLNELLGQDISGMECMTPDEAKDLANRIFGSGEE